MISVCMLSKNSAATIANALASVSTFAEVILLDNNSTDDTLVIARQFPNVRIINHPFIGFGPLRNAAAAYAANDWILALDTDEELSSPLLAEIASLPLDPALTYSMPRHNCYNKKHIKGCGWHPDRVVRLYYRKNARYSEDQVHESVLSPFTPRQLQNPILHTPFRSTTQFLAKMEHYSTLFAEQYAGKKKGSPLKAILHSCFAFIRSYFLRMGWKLGAEGFIVSLYNSNSTFYKYIKLWEKNDHCKRD